MRVAPRQLEGGLDGFGAGVGEEHLGPGRGLASSSSFSARAIWVGLVKKFETWPRVASWLEITEVTNGCGVAEGVDRDAAEQVQVLLAVGVPDEAAGAAHQDALRGAEDARAASRGTLLATEAAAPPRVRPDVAAAARPAGTRAGRQEFRSCVHFLVRDDLRADARGRKGFQQHRVRPAGRPRCAPARRPPSTAFRQASIFGIMPDSRLGSSSRSSEAVSEEISEDRSGQLA